MKIILKKTIEYLFYLFVFVFVFQTKLIIFPAEINYNEVSIYLNYFLLLIILLLFLFYFFRYKNKKDFKSDYFIDKYWIILVAWEFFVFISVFISPIKEVSIFKYVLFLIAIGLLFLMTNFKFNFKKIIYIFLISMLVQASLGLWQFFSQKSFSNKYLGMASHEASVLGVSVLEGDWGRLVRAYGATDHPNVFGALMFFAIIFLILIISKNNWNGYKKILAYLLLFIFLLAIIVSFSRSAILALFISLLFLFFIFLFNKDSEKFKRYNQVLIASLVFCVCFFIILKPLLLSRVDVGSRLEQISINERSDQIIASTKIIKKNTFLGVGLGAYSYELLNINSNWEPHQAQPVHNSFLLIWSEIGLWGLIFFIWFILYLFKKNVLDLQYSPLFIGLFIFMMLDHWLWSLPFGMLFMFFIVSLTFYLKYDIV